MTSKSKSPYTDDTESLDAVSLVRAYHHRTKHLPERPALGPGYLDWENQPDPFRRFSGAQMVEMPFDPGDDTPTYDSLFESKQIPIRDLNIESLSLFLELSLGLSAWKSFQGTQWALRNNPSSGNLHPTEGYVIMPPVSDFSNDGGIYHYAPKEHALERRCRLNSAASDNLAATLPTGGFLIGLTSVHWREAWKYGERAYRYCQHDAGHALGGLCISAAALGWRVVLLSAPSDEAVAGLLGIDRSDDFVDGEAEHPDLIATVLTTPNSTSFKKFPEDFISNVRASNWSGKANQLSLERVNWPAISMVEKAALKPPKKFIPLQATSTIDLQPSKPICLGPSAATIIRQRRSAVDMDGRTGLSRDTFLGMLARTLPQHMHSPWAAIGMPPRISLCLFVHRIDGLSPGLYIFMRDKARIDAFRAACNDKFLWEPVESNEMPLYALYFGDYRQIAIQASCSQEIAGDGAFSLGMIADFSRTLEEEGAWAYRRLFWESGLIGQILYLEAEAAGVRATGIGCFFDDVVHRQLGFDPASDDWQSLYHFTVGGAVDDGRLTTLPAYDQLPHRQATTGREK